MKTLHVARRTPLDWVVLVARIVVGLTFVASGTLILIGVMDLSDIFSRLGAPDWMSPSSACCKSPEVSVCSSRSSPALRQSGSRS
jgi:hypothetical protein